MALPAALAAIIAKGPRPTLTTAEAREIEVDDFDAILTSLGDEAFADRVQKPRFRVKAISKPLTA